MSNPGRFPLLVLPFLLLGSCTTEHYVDFPDVDLPAPHERDFERWEKEAAEGTLWRTDPKEVAHRAILSALSVPWSGQPYRASDYEIREDRKEWGPYVVRGYVEPSRRVVRYRVKMASRGKIWYARQVSHYMYLELPHPAMEDEY